MNDQLEDILSVSNSSSKIQLWQFLLELLIDKQNSNLIKWCGYDGEFEFLEPDKVASLWGAKKMNPSMNWSKLSRSLRNYYALGIICKIPCRQYSYKFTFDLKNFFGYSVQELCKIVIK